MQHERGIAAEQLRCVDAQGDLPGHTLLGIALGAAPSVLVRHMLFMPPSQEHACVCAK